MLKGVTRCKKVSKGVYGVIRCKVALLKALDLSSVPFSDSSSDRPISTMLPPKLHNTWS